MNNNVLTALKYNVEFLLENWTMILPNAHLTGQMLQHTITLK